MYDDWLDRITTKFDDAFKHIEPRHNFDLGPETEIAICEVLRELLPGRAEVCRGSIVASDDKVAIGDDVIVFDAANFAPLRGIGADLSRKQKIPGDAVLAYIEVKHTLQLSGSGGSSLAKAFSQAIGVKQLLRRRVPMEDIGNGTQVSETKIDAPAGFPNYRNPWYSAIWARNVQPTDHAEIFASNFLGERQRSGSLMPDCIAAGDLLALPSDVVGGPANPVPFCWGDATLASVRLPNALARAAVHLLWATSWIRLNPIPWARLVIEDMQQTPFVSYRLR